MSSCVGAERRGDGGGGGAGGEGKFAGYNM